MMQDRIELRLSGSGGQGVILAGIILAEAALLEGKNALQSQSYGPEARGGASKSEVIISEKDIDYPKVARPNIFLALTQEAYNKYSQGMTTDGVAVIDASINPGETGNRKVYAVPILDVARLEIGKPIVSNIVALGALAKLTKVVSLEALEQAVLSRVPRGTEELNKRALSAGVAAAVKIIGD